METGNMQPVIFEICNIKLVKVTLGRNQQTEL